MKKTQIIDNIQQYDVFNDLLIFEKENTLFVNGTEFKNNNYDEFYIYNNSIYMSNDDEQGLFKYDDSSKLIIKYKENMHYDRDEFLVEKSNGVFNYYLDDFKYVFSSKYKFHFIENKVGVLPVRDSGYLLRINKLRGISIDDNIIWEYNISEELPFDIYRDDKDYAKTLVGIVGGKLWVYSRGGRLVALDVETGKVLKVFSNFKEDEKYGFTIHNGLGDIFKKENDDDYLYCLGLVFQKIDVHTMEIVENFDYKQDKELQEFETIMNLKLQGDYFTFQAGLPTDNRPRYAGVYDYNNRKTVWVEEILSEEDYNKTGNCLIDTLQMHGDKLYIKDRHNNLHIFEKEQTSV